MAQIYGEGEGGLLRSMVRERVGPQIYGEAEGGWLRSMVRERVGYSDLW